MMDLQQFMMVTALQEETFQTWVAFGWLTPERNGGIWTFNERDVARAHLVEDLVNEYGLGDVGIDAMLAVVDRADTLRREMRTLLAGVRTLPELLGRRIATELQNGAAAESRGEPPADRYAAAMWSH